MILLHHTSLAHFLDLLNVLFLEPLLLSTRSPPFLYRLLRLLPLPIPFLQCLLESNPPTMISPPQSLETLLHHRTFSSASTNQQPSAISHHHLSSTSCPIFILQSNKKPSHSSLQALSFLSWIKWVFLLSGLMSLFRVLLVKRNGSDPREQPFVLFVWFVVVLLETQGKRSSSFGRLEVLC